MKNLIIVFITGVLCFGFIPDTTAQEEGYEEGKTYFDIGIGAPRFGLVNNYIYNIYGYNSYNMPVLRANLEYGFTDFISGGLYAGYSHYGWSWSNSLGDWDERYSYLSLGLRGTFHIWDFLNKHLELGLGVDQFDLYASLMLGVRVKSMTDKTPSNRNTSRYSDVFVGTTVGAKYYFTQRAAVFLEGGYGSSSFGIIGLSFKF